jgi:beta-glucosidase
MTAAAALLLLLPGTAAMAASDQPDYRNAQLSAQARAADLVSRMTLEEKAGQLRSSAPAIPRLGVPAYDWWSEGLHGVARADYATVFPQAIGMAATFDSHLIGDIADVIGTEFRAKYVKTVGADGSSTKYRGLTVWSPNINIFRDPRWGRGQETYGEDPFLTTELGVAFIKGLQGTDPKYFKTVATAKHFAVHSGPEADRHREDVYPSAHDLADTYLPAFHDAVVKANVQAVMCSYNSINGVPACGNADFLEGIVRKQWGFQGHIVTDCGAIGDFFEPDAHHYSKSPKEAVAKAFSAGTDLICDEFGYNKSKDIQPILDAVNEGLLPVADVDRAARKIFEARMALGLFNNTGEKPFSSIAPADNDTSAHRDLARKAAEASLVLLKNTGLLPLKKAPSRIAVIGPNAASTDALVGNYNGTPSKPVNFVDGLRARFPKSVVEYVEGSGLIGPPMEKVPASAFCEDDTCKVSGVKAETFNNLKLEGAAAKQENVKSVAFRWGSPVREQRDTSMRWSGVIVASETGPFRFTYTGQTQFRIFVNGTLVNDAWAADAPEKQIPITLTKDGHYKIVVEAVQSGTRGNQFLTWSRPSTDGDSALAAAKKADLVVFVGGLSAAIEGEAMPVKAPGFVGGDRTNIELPQPQEALLERLHATGKPVVLVLASGSAMGVNWADAHLPVIIQAWYPGEEGGSAVASLIAGDFSPSGRLPVTFYKSVNDLPDFKNYNMAGRTYRYFSGTPLYPFGFGLSYTSFAYGKPVLSKAVVKAGEAVEVTVPVRNTGHVTGDEVVQLYVSSSQKGAPIRSLKAVERITLKPGESRSVHFTLDAKAMSVVTSDGKRVVETGPVNIWIGGGQPVARAGMPSAAGAKASVKVEGRKDLPVF